MWLAHRRPYGPVFDFLHHKIGSTHVAHDVCHQIPHYNADKATEALKNAFPQLYLYAPTPSHVVRKGDATVSRQGCFGIPLVLRVCCAFCRHCGESLVTALQCASGQMARTCTHHTCSRKQLKQHRRVKLWRICASLPPTII